MEKCVKLIVSNNIQQFEDLQLLGYLAQPYTVWHEDMLFIATL